MKSQWKQVQFPSNSRHNHFSTIVSSVMFCPPNIARALVVEVSERNRFEDLLKNVLNVYYDMYLLFIEFGMTLGWFESRKQIFLRNLGWLKLAWIICSIDNSVDNAGAHGGQAIWHVQYVGAMRYLPNGMGEDTSWDGQKISTSK